MAVAVIFRQSLYLHERNQPSPSQSESIHLRGLLSEIQSRIHFPGLKGDSLYNAQDINPLSILLLHVHLLSALIANRWLHRFTHVAIMYWGITLSQTLKRTTGLPRWVKCSWALSSGDLNSCCVLAWEKAGRTQRETKSQERQLKAGKIKHLRKSSIYSTVLPRTTLVQFAGEETRSINNLVNYKGLSLMNQYLALLSRRVGSFAFLKAVWPLPTSQGTVRQLGKPPWGSHPVQAHPKLWGVSSSTGLTVFFWTIKKGLPKWVHRLKNKRPTVDLLEESTVLE